MCICVHLYVYVCYTKKKDKMWQNFNIWGNLGILCIILATLLKKKKEKYQQLINENGGMTICSSRYCGLLLLSLLCEKNHVERPLIPNSEFWFEILTLTKPLIRENFIYIKKEERIV